MRRLGVLLLLLSLILVGCSKPQILGGKNRTVAYSRIVSLAPSTTEILGNTGVQIIGRTAACNFPENLLQVPVVATVKPDYEALAKMKPDLIVYDSDLYSAADIRKIEALGAKTYAFNPQSLTEYNRAVHEIGSLVGQETGFSSYVDRVYTEKQEAEGAPPTPRPKVAVIMPDASGRHMIAGTKGFLGEMVKISGGDQIGPDSGKFEPLNAEFLLTQNPDVIMVAGDRAVFEKDARLAGLKARRDGRVFGLPADVVLRRGARVNLLIQNLHKAFSLKGGELNAKAGN